MDWPAELHQELNALSISQVCYVPDAGHSRLIELSRADASLTTVALTSEEEGVGLAAGAWLGGRRAVVLMQSSGVGNIVNGVASLAVACQIPLLLLVTMRGDFGEANPWQIPMGQAVAPVLEAVGVLVRRVEQPDAVVPELRAAARMTFSGGPPVAVLLGQRLIGPKAFE